GGEGDDLEPVLTVGDALRGEGAGPFRAVAQQQLDGEFALRPGRGTHAGGQLHRVVALLGGHRGGGEGDVEPLDETAAPGDGGNGKRVGFVPGPDHADDLAFAVEDGTAEVPAVEVGIHPDGVEDTLDLHQGPDRARDDGDVGVILLGNVGRLPRGV